jgi:hypothetical protein
MTGKADFTAEEWDTVLEGPTSAGLIVSTAQRGGSFREILAMAKAYTEARKEHGESELLDEIVSRKPEVDRTRAHSPEELKEHGLQRIRDAVALPAQRRPRRSSTTIGVSSSRSPSGSPAPRARRTVSRSAIRRKRL